MTDTKGTRADGGLNIVMRHTDIRVDDCARGKEETEIERLRDALERIVQWSEAYPLDIFPEPDFAKAQEVLTANGMTLDAISASCMRHVVEGVGKIAREALGESSP
jgi:hypothetical protein